MPDVSIREQRHNLNKFAELMASVEEKIRLQGSGVAGGEHRHIAGQDHWRVKGMLLPIDVGFQDSKTPRC